MDYGKGEYIEKVEPQTRFFFCVAYKKNKSVQNYGTRVDLVAIEPWNIVFVYLFL